jgi:hypothetical protein
MSSLASRVRAATAQARPTSLSSLSKESAGGGGTSGPSFPPPRPPAPSFPLSVPGGRPHCHVLHRGFLALMVCCFLCFQGVGR